MKTESGLNQINMHQSFVPIHFDYLPVWLSNANAHSSRVIARMHFARGYYHQRRSQLLNLQSVILMQKKVNFGSSNKHSTDYAAAQNNLGFMYANGQGVAQDYSEALKWYRLAAAQDQSPAA
jgi:TPR repeat protein